MSFVTFSKESNQYVQCEKCHIKFNKSITKRCGICFPKKQKTNSEARKKRNKKYYEKLKLNNQKYEILTEINKPIPPKVHDYFGKGKRKDYPT